MKENLQSGLLPVAHGMNQILHGVASQKNLKSLKYA
jgi:hypothetical protein